MRLLKKWFFPLILVLTGSFLLQIFSRVHVMLRDPISLDIYNIAYPRPYNYILNEPQKCSGKPPFLVLMIPVAPENRKVRDVIRETWGDENSMPTVTIRRIFYLGLPSQNRRGGLQEELERESRRHHDLVQKDFQDTYLNLTIKTMMMMDWLASYCPKASYAMKIDTDMFLNVDTLVNKLLQPQAPHAKVNFITGNVLHFGIIRRDQDSKWYMPFKLVPGLFYPTYVSGIGYVFSVDLAQKILSASLSVVPVYLEDVYVGMCLQELGIQPTQPADSNWFSLYPVAYSRCRFSRLISVSHLEPDQLLYIWKDLEKAKDHC
ncbi:beta-1,3-galactosyltransferase 2-like [Polypterus senegalus]